MSDLSKHANAMLELIKDYAKQQGIFEDVSGLLIVREVQKPGEPDRPLNMAIMGEEPTVAIQTLHYAGVILTSELRALTTRAIGATTDGKK
jgi:hypothetical protein